MKGEAHLYGVRHGREVAARIIDGRLEDLFVDTDDPRPGAIFRGKAIRKAGGQGGMFFETPFGNAYLRQAAHISLGEHHLLQITGFAEPGKALPVTTRLVFKGRHAMVTPGAPGINVARSIRDEEARVRLLEIAHEFSGDLGDCGLILRTQSASAEDDALRGDLEAQLDVALAVLGDTDQSVEHLVDGPGAADLAYREWPDAPRDGGELDEYLTYAMARDFPLPQGGSLSVETTRALVAIDVNTGGDTSPAAGLNANIAAARDIPRLLRLKGLGGQVVVDFAPMPKKNRRALEQALTKALRADQVETAMVGWTTMGLFELQRKRERWPLADLLRG